MLLCMAIPRPQPVEIQEHAIDNLRYIRRTMERAGSFTAVSGVGGVVMGLLALAAAWLASAVDAPGGMRWLDVWMAAAIAAVVVGVATAAQKSRRAGLPLVSGPGRKFVAGFAPAMLAGGLLTAVLFREGHTALLPGVWMLLYGTAVVSGGSASVRIVPLMGAGFMALGAVSLLLPGLAPNQLLAAGFGGLHIVFGTMIVVKYGG